MANAALVQPDANGQISFYAKDDTDLVIDVVGYFASGSGGRSLYTMASCRTFDTRTTVPALRLTGTQMIPMSDNACGATLGVQAYLFNTGVIPQEDTLAYLQLWAHGGSQPPTSTLNAVDGAITSNMAVVPTINGAINAYTTNATHLVLDVYGYFAP